MPVASFNEDNIIGSVQLNSGSQNDYYNCIDASYTNPKNDYANDVIRFPSDIMESGILVKDGTIKKKDEDYLLVQDKEQLAFLVNTEILKSKYINSTIQFNTYDALNVSVWDVITVTYDELGYVDKKFRVASKTLPFSAEQIGLCQLSCVEYYDEIYEGTDTGIFPQDGFKTNLPDASTVIAPANIQVVKKGTSSNGNIVTITWDHSTDHNLAGYYVKYRESTSSSWIEIGSVNKYTSSFEISLPTNRAYQFSVQAYNNLGYFSALISTGNIIPVYNFTLPSITGLRLLNETTSALITDAQDFRFQWDDQSHLVVNGKKFSDYFRYYEVRLYNGSTYIKSFDVTSTSFDLTHDLNTAGRKPTIGIIAHGFNAGTYSAEVNVTVENKQHAIPSNVSVKGGFGSLYISWAKSTEKDYAGTQIAIVDGNKSTVTNTTESEFTSINLDDGTYKIRVGHYDVFGTDNIIFSTEQTVTIKSDYQFSQEDVDNIQELLDLSGELSTVLDDAKTFTNTQISNAKTYTDSQIASTKTYTDNQMANAIQTANTNTTTKITQAKSEISTDTANKITASETKLTTSYINADSALNQKISTLETSTNTKISDTNSKITTLEKTVSDGDKANSTLITNLESSFNTKLNTTNANISTLQATVTNNNTAQTTANNTLESSFNTKLNSTNANVSTLQKTVSDNQSANASSIENLDTKFTDLNTTTNTTITNLSNAVSTQNSANASQFTLINSTLNSDITNLFYNPNALGSLSSGFSSGGATIISSTTAHTSTVYKLTARDNLGTKTLQVTPGDVYNLSMYCQTDDTTAPNIAIGMRFIDKAGATVSWAGAVSRGVNGTWAKIEGQITVPVKAVTAVIWIQLDKVGTDYTKYWYVTGISVSNANIYAKVNAQISTLNTAMTAADQANATAINQVQTNLNNNTATVNTKIDTSISTLTNNINSTYSLTANANGVVSGIKLVANSGASTNSAIYFVADKFVVSPASSTANAKSPFTVDSGIVYLNNAMIKNASIGTALIADASISNAKIANASINNVKIQDGTITNAKIANGQIDRAKITNSLQSDNYVSGSTGMLLNFQTGTVEINGSGTGGRMTQSNDRIDIYDANGNLRVRIGRL